MKKILLLSTLMITTCFGSSAEDEFRSADITDALCTSEFTAERIAPFLVARDLASLSVTGHTVRAFSGSALTRLEAWAKSPYAVGQALRVAARMGPLEGVEDTNFLRTPMHVSAIILYAFQNPEAIAELPESDALVKTFGAERTVMLFFAKELQAKLKEGIDLRNITCKEEAIALFQSILTTPDSVLKPDDNVLSTQVLAANALAYMDAPEGVLEFCSTLLDRIDVSFWTLYYVSTALKKISAFDLAARGFKQMISDVAPLTTRSLGATLYFNLAGKHLYDLGKHEDALKAHQAMLRIAATSAPFSHEIPVQEIEKALTALEQYRAIEPLMNNAYALITSEFAYLSAKVAAAKALLRHHSERDAVFDLCTSILERADREAVSIVLFAANAFKELNHPDLAVRAYEGILANPHASEESKEIALAQIEELAAEAEEEDY